MAVDDIRLKLSIRTSRKYKRLRRILGAGAMEALVFFWMAVAESAPDGDISAWSDFDLADATGYPGDPSELHAALVDVGFIDLHENGAKTVHNWLARQPFVMYSDRRKLQAQMAAAKRWGNIDLYTTLQSKLYGKQTVDADSNAVSMQTAMPTNTNTTLKDYKACSIKDCNKPVDQPHHSKCRSCYSPNYRDPPTTRHQQYPRCPYCKREQTGIEVDHQAMNCSICEDEPK